MKIKQVIEVLKLISFTNNERKPSSFGCLCNLVPNVPKELVYNVLSHISGNKTFNDNTLIEYLDTNTICSDNLENSIQIYPRKVLECMSFCEILL